MAVVGEAHVIVRAITTGVSRDIKNGFKDVDGRVAQAAGRNLGNSFSRGWSNSQGANVFKRISAGLSSIAPNAEATAKQFRTLVRTGYFLGTALSVVLGGIGSVVASLGTLVSALAAAVPAGMALVNVFVSMGVAAKTFGFAMKGISGAVSQATGANSALGQSLADVREEFQQLRFDAEAAALSEERAALQLEAARENLMRTADLPPNSTARREAELAFKEADLNYRRAKDRTQDLNEEVAKGPEALRDATGGTDPYANLTESQKVFAQFLVNEIIPGIKELREVVAANLLVPMIDDIRALNSTWLPLLKTGLAGIATSTEGAISTVIAELNTDETVSEASEAFEGMGTNIEKVGEIAANLIDIFTDLTVAAQPLTERFLDFLIDKTDSWATSLDNLQENGSLTEFFNTAGDIAAQWGRIIGNIFDGFGDIIAANFEEGGAGWSLLDWFEEATESFATLNENTDLGQYFSDSLDNTRSIFSAIGAFLKEILKVADNPNIGKTFDNLKEGAAPFGEILEKSIDAAPAFGELITNIIGIINAFTDTDQMTSFFETLNVAAENTRKFLESDFVQSIMKVLGPIFAIGLALGGLNNVFKFFRDAIIGIALPPLNLLGGGFDKLKQKAAFLTYSKNPIARGFGKLGSFLLTGPGGLVLLAITTLIASFIYLYNTSDSFRAFVENVFNKTLESLSGAWERIQTAIQPLMDVLTGELIPALMTILEPILKVIVGLLGTMAMVFGEVLARAIEFIVPIIVRLIEMLTPTLTIFGEMIRLVGAFAEALFTQDWDKFGEIFKDVLWNILTALAEQANAVGNLIVDLLNNMIAGFFNGFGGGIADLIKTFSGGSIDLKANPPQIPNFPPFAAIPRFAMGGVVYPSAGGSIVQVAEAGRPERIEPLDPDGLSARDRAIIAELSPTGGGDINITVNPAPGMDEKELAKAVSRQLAFEIRKGTV